MHIILQPSIIMKAIKIILAIVAFSLVSCNTSESLDKYYVTHQEKQGFMTIDVPTDILEIETSSLTATQKEAYKSVSKLNFLGFKKSKSNAATFAAEKQNIKEILSNSKYKDLITFHHEDKEGMVKYVGNSDAIDELVLFGAEDAEGFAIVRVLGNDMNPQNIFELLRSLKEQDINTDELKKIGNFFAKK